MTAYWRRSAGGRGRKPRSEPSQEPREVGADALKHRDRRVGQREGLAGDRLENADIESRSLEDDVARNLGDLVLVRVAARHHPAAHEILVEALGRLAGGETLGIGAVEPIAAAIRRVDLVGEDDLAVLVEAELVFRVDQDEAMPFGDGAAAGEEGEGEGRDLLPLRRRQKAAFDDLRLGQLL